MNKIKDMKNIIKIVVLFFCVTNAFAQQVPLTSQYMFNNYLLNPAESGSVDYIKASISARAQWTGLEGSPKTQFFSMESKLGEKMGIGGYVYKDETGRRVMPITDNSLDDMLGVDSDDTASGFIYILKSCSSKPEISLLTNLYKIGFSF